MCLFLRKNSFVDYAQFCSCPLGLSRQPNLPEVRQGNYFHTPSHFQFRKKKKQKLEKDKKNFTKPGRLAYHLDFSEVGEGVKATQKQWIQEVGKMVQSAEFLQHNHENLSSDLQDPDRYL